MNYEKYYWIAETPHGPYEYELRGHGGKVIFGGSYMACSTQMYELTKDPERMKTDYQRARGKLYRDLRKGRDHV